MFLFWCNIVSPSAWSWSSGSIQPWSYIGRMAGFWRSLTENCYGDTFHFLHSLHLSYLTAKQHIYSSLWKLLCTREAHPFQGMSLKVLSYQFPLLLVFTNYWNDTCIQCMHIWHRKRPIWIYHTCNNYHAHCLEVFFQHLQLCSHALSHSLACNIKEVKASSKNGKYLKMLFT